MQSADCEGCLYFCSILLKVGKIEPVIFKCRLTGLACLFSYNKTLEEFKLKLLKWIWAFAALKWDHLYSINPNPVDSTTTAVLWFSKGILSLFFLPCDTQL